MSKTQKSLRKVSLFNEFFVCLNSGQKIQINSTTNSGACKAYVVYTEEDNADFNDKTRMVSIDEAAKDLVQARPAVHSFAQTKVVSINVVNTGGSNELVEVILHDSQFSHIIGSMLVPASNTVVWRYNATSLIDGDGEISIVGLKTSSQSGGGSGSGLNHTSVNISLVAGVPFSYAAPGTVVEYMLLAGSSNEDVLATVEVAGAQVTISPDITFSATLHVIYK